MKEYKIAKGWAILMYIGSPLLIALFAWMGVMPFLPGEDMPSDLALIFVPLSLTMITIMVLGLIDTVKGRFVIDTDRIYTTNVFNKRMLLFSEIKGFRIEDKYIFVEPIDKKKKRIKISTYYGKCDEIKEWLYEHYDDLALVNLMAEEKTILEDVQFGRTTEERENRLQRARLATRTLSGVSFAVAAWAFFWPYPYEVVCLALLVFPILAVLLLKISGGIIHLNDRKDSAYPTVLYCIAVPSFMIVMRALIDYNILEYTNTWVPAVLVAVFMIIIALIGNTEFTFKKATDFFGVAGITLFFFCAAYGGLIFLNCYYDESPEQEFHVKVLSKRMSSGKHTSYYVELTPWGNQTEAEEVSIDSDLYDRFEAGDSAYVYLKQGRFDVPWFEVSK